MSALTCYLALAVAPLVVYGFDFLNPVAFGWGFRHGTVPMPPDIAERADRVGRYSQFPRHALLVVLILLLVSRYRIPIVQVGLRFEDWPLHLFTGCTAGLLWVAAVQRSVFHVFPVIRPGLATNYLQKGPALCWVLVFITGAFAEEFWLAFCLFALRNTGHSIAVSVSLVAIFFGAAHAGLGFGALAKGTFGIGAALLYVWSGSLVATYPAHLISNLGSLYWIRRTRLR